MSNLGIGVHNPDHLGIVAGIVDELRIVEYINDKLGIHPIEHAIDQYSGQFLEQRLKPAFYILHFTH